MNNYFKKNESIFFVKGYNRGIIIDTQRNDYQFAPNSLIDFVEEYDSKIIKNDIKAYYKNYLDFLFENEFAYYCNASEIDLFSPIVSKYESSSFIENSIIELNNNLDKKTFLKRLETLHELLCYNYLFFSYEEISEDILDNILNFFNNKLVDSVSFYLQYKDYKTIELLKRKINNFNFIQNVIFFNSDDDDTIEFGSQGYGVLIKAKNKLDFNSYDKNFNLFSKRLHHILEAKDYNTYFNNKVFIDSEGRIMNSPHSNTIFGNINELTTNSFKELINSSEFKKLWYSKKDDTNVCKDCEFRLICTDTRVPTFDKDIWYFDKECNYNPYISKWKNEIGYVDLENIGEYIEEKFIPNISTIENINYKIWKKA